MGVVYKAHDRTLDEDVAIKVLRPDFAQDPTMAERFKHEIKLARKVRHRNVCTIHDFGEDRGLLYISMELLEGVDLKKVLRQGGGLSPQRAYTIAIQVAEGLQAVHDAGIVHRDLKTSNIMLDPDGVARLLDFGVAKRLGDGTLTAAGHIVGTPEYMSPEQAQGKKVDFRSDIYALGIVLFEIFTGRVPFRGETPISTILKHINDPPPLQGPAAAGIPDKVRPILRRMLAKDPGLRYQSARDVAEALRKVAERGVDDRLPVTQVVALPRSAPAAAGAQRRSRALSPWMVGALALALVAVGIVVAVSKGRREEAPSASASLAPLPSLEPSVPPSPRIDPTPIPSPSLTPASPVVSAAPSPTAKPTTRPSPLVSQSPRSSQRIVESASPQAAPPASPSPSPPPASSEPGMLHVVVRPWGTVAVDGKVIGDTPLEKMRLAPGPHVVRVRHPAYEPWERTVVVRSGESGKILVDFLSEGVRKP
jgi:serine/threonine-protein kinase